jgi:hypothetical protein
MMAGDLVHITFDNAYQGVGLVVFNTTGSHVHHFRVLLEGRMLSVFDHEVEAVDEEGT